jgi:hypothetical protein
VHRFIWKTNGNGTERCFVERRGGNDGQHYADSGGIGDLRRDRAGDPDLPDEEESSALVTFRNKPGNDGVRTRMRAPRCFSVNRRD